MQLLGIGIIGLWALAIGSWLANIYKLCAHSPELAAWGAEQLIRIAGIPLAPLGVILGWF